MSQAPDPVLPHTDNAGSLPPPDASAKGSSIENRLLGVWLAGTLVCGVLALSPLRLPFLDRPLVAEVNMGEVAHFLALTWLAAAFPLIFRSWSRLLFSSLMLVLLGAVIEFFQMQIPHRRFSESDLVADVFGIVAGMMAGVPLRRVVRQSRGTTTAGEAEPLPQATDPGETRAEE